MTVTATSAGGEPRGRTLTARLTTGNSTRTETGADRTPFLSRRLPVKTMPSSVAVEPAVTQTVSGLMLPRIETFEPPSEPAKACPVCGRRGRRVIALTVTAHLRPEFWGVLGDGFWFCWTRECPVFYYNNDRAVYVSKDPREVRSRFGLKETESPRPICYCLGVGCERIVEEVEVKGCCDTLEDIERYTRAGTGKWCVTTNPAGVCCRVYLKDVVAECMVRASGTARAPVEGVASRLREDEVPGTAVELKVGGMDCEACGIAVSGLLEHSGGRNVRVSVPEGRAKLEMPRGTNLAKVLDELSDAGYPSKAAEG